MFTSTSWCPLWSISGSSLWIWLWCWMIHLKIGNLEKKYPTFFHFLQFVMMQSLTQNTMTTKDTNYSSCPCSMLKNVLTRNMLDLWTQIHYLSQAQHLSWCSMGQNQLFLVNMAKHCFDGGEEPPLLWERKRCSHAWPTFQLWWKLNTSLHLEGMLLNYTIQALWMCLENFPRETRIFPSSVLCATTCGIFTMMSISSMQWSGHPQNLGTTPSMPVGGSEAVKSQILQWCHDVGKVWMLAICIFSGWIQICEMNVELASPVPTTSNCARCLSWMFIVCCWRCPKKQPGSSFQCVYERWGSVGAWGFSTIFKRFCWYCGIVISGICWY